MRLRELLESKLAEHNLPALWAGKFGEGTPPVVDACGVRKWNDSDQAQIDDRLHLGSCTKAMTAALIGQLCSEDKFRLDTQLKEIFSDMPSLGDSPWGSVRLVDLMQHRSGAPANMPYARFDAAQPDDVVAARRMLLESLLKIPRTARPGYAYSNVGFILLGHAVERVENQPWETCIRQRLFEPLGISSAGFGPVGKPDGTPADAGAIPARPWGHTRRMALVQLVRKLFGMQDSMPWVPRQIDNMRCLGPAGRVHMSLRDWSAFVMPFAQRHGHDKLSIHKEVWDQMLRPAAGAPEPERYAAGWVIFEGSQYNGQALFHNGSNTTWYCYALAVPGKEHCVLVATNAYSGGAVQACDEVAQSMNANEIE